MSSINPQIDAAATGDRSRAEQFDQKPGILPMDEWVKRDGEAVVMKDLFNRAEDNLRRARTVAMWAEFGHFQEERAKCLHDARNLIALILSLEPADQPEGGES